MRYPNLRLAWNASADFVSGLKLTVATAATSHPKWRRVLDPILAVLSSREELWLSIRYRKKSLLACLRSQELEADMQGLREVVLQDCYGLARLGRPDVVLDGGANVGFFSMIAGALWQDARVVAVEPIEENADMIAKHAHANGSNPIVVRACIGGKAGVTRFYRRMANRGSMYGNDPYSETRDIRVSTLSALRREAGEGSCLVKLDIEGAEVEALREFLSVPQPRCTIVGELHHWPQHQAEFDRILASANYAVEYHARDPVCVLFVARSPDQSRAESVQPQSSAE